VQRHQVALMNSAGWRRITPGLTADLAADPELARTYLAEFIAPRRRPVWDALDRGIARGELPPASTTPSSPTCSPARCSTGPWAAASTSRPAPSPHTAP
jgi:Tetracyclin repressor-like, C-terminal domain